MMMVTTTRRLIVFAPSSVKAASISKLIETLGVKTDVICEKRQTPNSIADNAKTKTLIPSNDALCDSQWSLRRPHHDRHTSPDDAVITHTQIKLLWQIHC
jgi:hypothetical protein